MVENWLKIVFLVIWHDFCINKNIFGNGAGQDRKGLDMDKKITLQKNDNLEVYMFNVGRGLSMLVKTPHNYAMLYDLGSSEDLSPIADIYRKPGFFSQMVGTERKIAQCIISHPHLDHISDLTDENADYVNRQSMLVSCQNDKDVGQVDGHKIDFSRIKNPGGDKKVDNYKSLYCERNLPLVTFNPDVDGVDFQVGYYYLTHEQADALFPKNDQEYANSLSIVLYMSYCGSTILIPGDITPDAFDLILNGKCEKRFTDYKRKMKEDKRQKWAQETSDQPNLKTLLEKKGLTVLVAPHHGLESGYPQSLFDLLGDNKPKIILISEKPQSENSGSVDKKYQDGTCSKGVGFDGKTRYSLTTRNDGHIKVCFKSDGKGSVDYFSDYKGMF